MPRKKVTWSKLEKEDNTDLFNAKELKNMTLGYRKNHQAISNLMHGEYHREENKERNSENCIKCFMFFLDIVDSPIIENKIKFSIFLDLNFIRTDLNQAMERVVESVRLERMAQLDSHVQRISDESAKVDNSFSRS